MSDDELPQETKALIAMLGAAMCGECVLNVRVFACACVLHVCTFFSIMTVRSPGSVCLLPPEEVAFTRSLHFKVMIEFFIVISIILHCNTQPLSASFLHRLLRPMPLRLQPQRRSHTSVPAYHKHYCIQFNTVAHPSITHRLFRPTSLRLQPERRSHTSVPAHCRSPSGR